MKLAMAKPGGGIDGLEFREAPVPQPGPGEALVRLRAATLNFRDLLFIKGVLPYAKSPEYVPLSCATGEVVALGEGVTQLKVGDRVNPLFHQRAKPDEAQSPEMLGGSVDGVARTHGVFPADSLALVPDELGDLEAATFACAGLTAWSSLFGARPLKPGERVLVQGTGGVSMAALQWAKAAGGVVAATSSSDAKLRRARALGADVTVNYRTQSDWAGAVREALGGEGVDIVVDVAGANQLAAAAGLLNEGGIIAAVGMLDGDFSWNSDIGKTIVPIGVGSPNQHRAMSAFAAEHGVRPVVDAVYDLERLGDAMRHHESGRFFGKVGVNLL